MKSLLFVAATLFSIPSMANGQDVNHKSVLCKLLYRNSPTDYNGSGDFDLNAEEGASSHADLVSFRASLMADSQGFSLEFYTKQGVLLKSLRFPYEEIIVNQVFSDESSSARVDFSCWTFDQTSQ